MQIFRFTFKAVATDKGSPPLNSTVSVNIEVIKNDINPPVWEKSNYTVEIPENAKEDSIVISLRARYSIYKNSLLQC